MTRISAKSRPATRALYTKILRLASEGMRPRFIYEELGGRYKYTYIENILTVLRKSHNIPRHKGGRLPGANYHLPSVNTTPYRQRRLVRNGGGVWV